MNHEGQEPILNPFPIIGQWTRVLKLRASSFFSGIIDIYEAAQPGITTWSGSLIIFPKYGAVSKSPKSCNVQNVTRLLHATL
jgi:hypothetical protein